MLTHELTIEFESEQFASIAQKVLSVELELHPGKTAVTYTTEGSVLQVKVSAIDWRYMVLKTNSVYENLELVCRTLEECSEHGPNF